MREHAVRTKGLPFRTKLFISFPFVLKGSPFVLNFFGIFLGFPFVLKSFPFVLMTFPFVLKTTEQLNPSVRVLE